MQPFEPSELKALFGQLVDSVGTQEAAATFLGVSRQRVGQLISTATPDLPTWAQVFKLEQVCGVSIVFAAFARKTSSRGVNDAMASGLLTAATATAFSQALHVAGSDGFIDPREGDRLLDEARRTLESAQTQYDAALRLVRVSAPEAVQ